MPNFSDATVAMQCKGGTILATGAKGTVNGEVVTVTSSSWKMTPTANDGRAYYVIIGNGRSWKCSCSACDGRTATFPVTETNPC